MEDAIAKTAPPTRPRYEIVYNLEYYQGFAYLPVAYITTRNADGTLTYLQHKVTTGTKSNYGDHFAPVHDQLLATVELLQIPTLEQRFNTKNRKKKPLAKLIETPEAKRMILKYIDQQLSALIGLIVEHRLPICYDGQRKDWIKDIDLKISHRPLYPDLHFKKTSEGIYYRMQLASGEFNWRIKNRDVKVLTNTPAWLVINGRVHRVQHINGNMVKPFIRKDEVFIKRSMVKEYFQKFILKIITQSTINAEGFDIELHDKMKHGMVQFKNNFMTGEYGIEVSFIYDNVEFGIDEKVRHKTSLEFNSSDDIVVHQYQRSRLREQEMTEYLEALGMKRSAGRFMLLNDDTPHQKPFPVMEWLIKHRTELEQFGFKVATMEWESKSISLATPSLQLDLKQLNDWFDLYGVIEVEGFTIPFYSLAQYIKQYIRLYPLPNGAYFIIPVEWMERYQALFQIAKINKNGIRLSKSQYPVLQSLDIAKLDDLTQDTLQKDFRDIEYSEPPSLKATLRPYQLDGVKWLINLYNNNLGGCLADDMGLGKTLQTIAMLLYAKEQKSNLANNDKSAATTKATQLSMFSAHQAALQDFSPLNALIILPASLVFNWAEEVKKFAPQLTVYKHVGTRRHKKAELLTGFDVMLTTYHTCLKDIELLRPLLFEYVVLDESQQIKNKDSKIFKAINQLQANHKISLSGTPIENSLSDLWAQMQFINPELLGSYNFFKKAFIAPIERMQNEVQKERLRELIAPYLLRRTKESVAKDLPELTYRIFYSEMSTEQRKLYEREKSAARNYILDNYDKSLKFSNVVLNTLMKLRQIANHPLLVSDEYYYKSGKFNDVIHHMETIQKGGHKTLIFSQFVSHLKLFKNHFDKNKWRYSWLTGADSSKKREQAISQFQQEEAIKAFLISLKAGGTGLNLTAADYVFITDPWWNPSAERQAIARAHRIGQTKNVIAIKFITKDTIEEKILKLQERKTQLAEDIIENNEKIQFSQNDLAFLLD